MKDDRDHSAHQIYIRNHLYALFEEKANEMGYTVDYLIHESMRTYAKEQQWTGALDPQGGNPTPPLPPPIPNRRGSDQFAGGRPLYLWFNQQRYVIDKARFIIGRGGVEQHCDLVIPDTNISRNHCIITYRNGAHHIRDLDSTNGIEFQGEKISQHRIRGGEQFYLCDYPISFTYQAHQVFNS